MAEAGITKKILLLGTRNSLKIILRGAAESGTHEGPETLVYRPSDKAQSWREAEPSG